jgi:uncharacterized protein YxeA
MKKIIFIVLLALSVSILPTLSYGATSTYKKVNKDAHSLVVQKVYVSQSTKSKTLGTLQKNQNIYVYGSQYSWYQIGYGKTKGWVVAKNIKFGKYVAPPVTVNKDGISTITQRIYASQSTSSKVLAVVAKNQSIHILASQNGWYQINMKGIKGWIPARNAKIVTPSTPPTTGSGGKTYPDGWVAPVLKSAWSPNSDTNFVTLQNELGFTDGGHYYNIYGKAHAIVVNGDSGDNEVTFKFYLWTDSALPQSYRIPIVAKELFKLYFGDDATRVWNYCNSNDVPEQFTANGRLVKVSFIESDGSMYFQVGKKE